MKNKNPNGSDTVIRLGDRVRDTISGGEGIVTITSQHITGCDRVMIEMAVNDRGESPTMWLDVTRCEILKAMAVPDWVGTVQAAFDAGQPAPAGG